MAEYDDMGLSAEELAALNDDIVETPTADDPPADPPADDPSPVDNPDDSDDSDDPADPPVDEPNDPPADHPGDDPADPPAPLDPPADDDVRYKDLALKDFSPYQVTHVQDFDAQMQIFDQRRNDMVQKFRDGEITLEDYLIQDRALKVEEDRVRDKERDASVMEKMNEQNATRTWFENVDTFINHVQKVDGINYKNTTLNAALDAAVKALANEKENADKPQAWFLTEAHKRVMADLGIARRASNPDPKPAAKKEERKPDLRNVPKTLSRVPAAAPNNPRGDDEFGHLEKLDGIELERALAKLTPEQESRYLRGF